MFEKRSLRASFRPASVVFFTRYLTEGIKYVHTLGIYTKNRRKKKWKIKFSTSNNHFIIKKSITILATKLKLKTISTQTHRSNFITNITSSHINITTAINCKTFTETISTNIEANAFFHCIDGCNAGAEFVATACRYVHYNWLATKSFLTIQWNWMAIQSQWITS